MKNLTKKTDSFSVEDTTAIKGIAIILLLFYHCFSSEDRLFGNVTFLLSKSHEMWIFNAANVCVGMFAVLSAYGITMASKKFWDAKEKDREMKGYFVHRFFSLLPDFWFVYILVFIVTIIGGFSVPYGKLNFDGIVLGISDFMGMAYWFQSPSLCATWWYIGFTILVIFLLPVIDRITKYFSLIGTMGLFFGAVVVFQIPITNMTRWLPAIILGYGAARGNWFVRMKACKNRGKLIFDLLLLGLLMYFRQSSSGYYYFSYITHGIAPLYVIYFCYCYIERIPGVHSVLVF